MPALAVVTAVFYGLISLLYLIRVFRQDERLRRITCGTVVVVLIVHAVTIGSFCLRGFHPLVGVAGTLNLIAFLLVAAFFFVSLKWALPVAGAVIVPFAMALVLSAQLTPQGPPPGALPHVLGKLHLTLVAMGVTALALASAVAVGYLRQNRALQNNQLLALESTAPALSTLDRLSLRLTLVGFPLFVLAVITGALWSYHLHEGFRIEHALSGLILLIYLVLVSARISIGLRGRRAAILTLSGFFVTALVLAIYMARRVLS